MFMFSYYNNSILQWNCRSLRKRKYTLLHLAAVTQPFIIALQESFLANDSELLALKDLFPSFNFYFKNRPKDGPANPRGGVALMVLKSVPQSLLQLNTHLEAIAIKILYRGKNVTVSSLYLPPARAFTVPSLVNLISQLPGDRLLLGDFNAHHPNWGAERASYRGNKIIEFLQSVDMVLLNTGEPTRFSPSGSASHVDLSLASPAIAADIKWSTYSDDLGSDHLPIVLQFGAALTESEACLPLCRYGMKNADWVAYKNAAGVDFDSVVADEMLTSVRAGIDAAADATLPRISATRRHILVLWWTHRCRDAVRNRNAAYNRYRRNRCHRLLLEYKKARAIARRTIREAKRVSWRSFVSQITANTPPAQVWDTIRKLRSKDSSRPMYLRVNGALVDDPRVIAEEIARYFASVSADSNLPRDFVDSRVEREAVLDFEGADTDSYNAPFTLSEFLLILDRLRGSSAGPDGIRIEMIQNLSRVDKCRLLEFYNILWTTRQFPSSWREAVTLPIPKPGKDRRETSSNRPIALTYVLCKLMERMVNRRLLSYLEDRGLLHPMQSGFRRGRSTYDNLLALEHDIKGSLCFNNFTAAVFLDIEKAYDMCSRWGILRKLHDCGLRGNLPMFIQSFIDQRSFQVKVGNCLSGAFTQANGVPQGSVLSPTLFLLAVNDILPNPPPGVKISMYADDIALWISSPSPRHCLMQLQSALDTLGNWSSYWGLRLSHEKSKAVLFSRPGAARSNRVRGIDLKLHLDGRPLEFVSQCRYLGVIFDSHMTWRPHIAALRAALTCRINILRAVSGRDWGADRASLLMLYKALVLSKMEYGSVLFSSAADSTLASLRSVQYQCLRIAAGTLANVRTDVLDVECDVLPLPSHFAFVALRTASAVIARAGHPLLRIFDEYERFIRLSSPPFSTRAHLLSVRYGSPLFRVDSVPVLPGDSCRRISEVVSLNAHLHRSDCPIALLQEARAIIDSYPRRYPYYTDGSKRESLSGAGVYSPDWSCGFRLPDCSSVFDSEAFAIHAAVQRAVEQGVPAVVFTDSQSALRAIVNGSSHPLIRKTCLLLLAPAARINLAWVPSHIGLHGNERADWWAKRALGYGLITPMPISSKTFISLTLQGLRRVWQSVWDARPFVFYKRSIGPTVTAQHRSRREEVALARLRTGRTIATHILPYYAGAPAICDHCGVPLTVYHMLIDCLLYVVHRRPIVDFFTQKRMSLNLMSIIQDDPAVVGLFLEYLRSTRLLEHI